MALMSSGRLKLRHIPQSASHKALQAPLLLYSFLVPTMLFVQLDLEVICIHQIRRGRVVKCLQGQIVPMSLHKFASNVVEKALTHGTAEQRSTLVSEMLDVATAPGPGSHASHAGLDSQEGGPGTDSGQAMQPLHELMKDQYGNYVVQKTLEVRDSHTVSSLHQYVCLVPVAMCPVALFSRAWLRGNCK